MIKKGDINLYSDNYIYKRARDDICNEWGNLKCPQKPTKQIEIDGGFKTALNK